MFSFRRIDITKRVMTRIVLLLCHVRKDGPRGGIQLCCLRKIKTTVPHMLITIALLMPCVPQSDLTPFIQSQLNKYTEKCSSACNMCCKSACYIYHTVTRMIRLMLLFSNFI